MSGKKGGPKVRQNCSWVKREVPQQLIKSSLHDETNHPDLLRTVRALSDYDAWVSNRLIPIVSKWIEENREEVIKDMEPDQMNDMGEAVESAYKILKESGWVDEQDESNKAGFVEESFSANPFWKKKTDALIEAEDKINES